MSDLQILVNELFELKRSASIMLRSLYKLHAISNRRGHVEVAAMYMDGIKKCKSIIEAADLSLNAMIPKDFLQQIKTPIK
jgi:hypothetical protein